MLLGLLAYLFLFPRPAYALTQAQTDYSYQLNLYIENYSQWQVFKQDYLKNATLDNQQKAILSAKQTIAAREKARAALFRQLGDSINQQVIDQPFVTDAQTKITQMVNYHLTQADTVQSIKTPAELSAFTLAEQKALVNSNRVYIQAQVVSKLTQLLRYQLESQRLLSLITPRLPKETLYPVKNGLDQITAYNTQIDTLTSQLKLNLTKLEQGEKSAQTFYSETSQIMANIRTIETNLVNILIDLDTNYASH